MACRSCQERRNRASQQARQVAQNISQGNVGGAARAATGLARNLTAGAAEMVGIKKKKEPTYIRKI